MSPELLFHLGLAGMGLAAVAAVVFLLRLSRSHKKLAKAFWEEYGLTRVEKSS